MKRKRALVLILAASMVFTTQFPVFAAEAEVSENSVSENTADTTEFSTELAEVKSDVETELENLSTLDAGVDYVKDEAFFYADSLEEAQKVAETYNAELDSFIEGIGVLKFQGEDVATAMEESLESQSANTRIFANYISEFDDIEYDNIEYDKDFDASILEDNFLAVSRNDTYYNSQWFHRYIEDGAAWESATGKNVKVAVIDTGIDYDHEDLANKLAGQYSALTGSTSKNDVDDKQGHGTHVSGIIAAEANNGKGGCGVAPDASIYMLKVSDGREIKGSDIFRALEYLTKGEGKNWNVDVVNMSIGGYGYTGALAEKYQSYVNALVNSGTTVVAAAGNEATSTPSYPACLDNVISVASSNVSGDLSYFSNYGSTVDIVAPGEKILSTYLNGKYEVLSGTSMASPVMAGVAALVYDAKGFAGSNSVSAVKNVEAKLMRSTDGMEYEYGDHSVTGCIDSLLAINTKYIKENSGTVLAEGSIIPVAIGKKIKFTICDENGKALKGVKSKDVQWSISTSANGVSIKNGALKIDKATSARTPVIITAVCNGTEYKLGAVTMPATKYFGYISGRKFVKSCKKNITVNQPVNMSQLSNIVGTEVYMCDKCEKKGSLRVYSVIGKAENMGYAASTSKKTLKNASVYYNAYGGISKFIPKKKGTYRFKCKALDGSGKTFTLVLKAI